MSRNVDDMNTRTVRHLAGLKQQMYDMKCIVRGSKNQIESEV